MRDRQRPKASEYPINTSTAYLARRPVFAPIERVRRSVDKGGTEWHVVGDGYEIRIRGDVLTERDCDLIEWLIAHGKPATIKGGRVACKFSLYEAAGALRQSRTRIIERIERLQTTLVEVREGDWICTAQIFGPTLRNFRSGIYVVTMTPEFVRILGHGVRVFYHDLVDDIIAISSPVVRRLVRRTLSHERRDRGERLTNILDEMRLTAQVANADDVRKIRKRAADDVRDAADYLLGVFGIEVSDAQHDREVVVTYVRDRRDGRLWIDAQAKPRGAGPDSAVP